jgi:hypothetical protein
MKKKEKEKKDNVCDRVRKKMKPCFCKDLG